jgi:hypothetical protein
MPPRYGSGIVLALVITALFLGIIPKANAQIYKPWSWWDKTWWVAVYRDQETGEEVEVYNHFKAKRTYDEVFRYFISDQRDCDSFIWKGYRDLETLCDNPEGDHSYMVRTVGPLVRVQPRVPPDER